MTDQTAASIGVGDIVKLGEQIYAALVSNVDIVALLLAILTPTLLIYARHEILLNRLRTILDFMQSFKLYGAAEGTDGKRNPSFEFVKSKYVSDIKIRAQDQAELDARDGNEEAKLKLYIALASRAGSGSSGRIYLASLGFIIASYFGFHALIGAFACNFRSIGSCEIQPTVSDQMLVVGSLAFAGAFVGSLRMLLRCLAVYDLSAFSMLRHTAEMVFTVIVVMMIFRAFPDPFFNVGKLLLPASVVAQIEAPKKDEQVPAPKEEDIQDPKKAEEQKANVLPGTMGSTDGGIPWLWFALAPALGLLPASSTRFLLSRMQSLISWMKTTDDRFADVSRIISLEIIDGIDFETRFRLEECGIYDVQNLATYNPVMLHVETPYGIYQTIDWIAQAQLCHIVGQEKFLMFRELNIRTIFDLERAIDSRDSPPAFDDIYASILFAPSENLKKVAAISQFRFLISDTNNLTRQVSVEEYCAWAREQIRGRATGTLDDAGLVELQSRLSEAVEHLMVWISDDLHIRRLRRLWLDISESLGKDAEYFPDSKRSTARKEYLDKVCAEWCKQKQEEEQKNGGPFRDAAQEGKSDQKAGDQSAVENEISETEVGQDDPNLVGSDTGTTSVSAEEEPGAEGRVAGTETAGEAADSADPGQVADGQETPPAAKDGSEVSPKPPEKQE